MNIQYFDTLESTNKYCELLNLDKIEEFATICALNQTAGRGQSTHQWVSEPYQNLSFSIILHPTLIPISEQYILTKVLSLGIHDFLTQILPNQDIKIKWPNDIYVGNNKICGILVNNKIKGGLYHSAICGIGINVNQTVFPQWVPNPTSLKNITQQQYDIKELLHQIINCIHTRYSQVKHSPENLHNDYLSRLLNLRQVKNYTYQGEIIHAAIQDVNHYGHLQLTTIDGEHISCQLGEVSLIQ